MVRATGADVCIAKSTRVSLGVDSLRVRGNENAGSIALSLTPESSVRWSEFQNSLVGKEMLLLSNGRSVLYFRVFTPQSDGRLTLFAANKAEAQEIARLIEPGWRQ